MAPETLAIMLAFITMTGMIVSSWLQSRASIARATVDELRKTIEALRQELMSCKTDAAKNLDRECGLRRDLQNELTQLKDDLARKNQELINALIERQIRSA